MSIATQDLKPPFPPRRSVRSLDDAREWRRLWDEADRLTRLLTAFPSFRAFVDADYRPTLRTADGPACVWLADAYDVVQAARGSDIRAYRGR